MNGIRQLFLFLPLFLLTYSLTANPAQTSAASKTGSPKAKILLLSLNGPIAAPAATYLTRGIQQAENEKANLLVLELNTPGGSGDAMLKIISAIDNATVPICVYVSPRGAMAASAGMYIAVSAPLTAMAPETTIGAAHPVNANGGNISGDERAKITNTFAAQARTQAKRYGRNAKWIEDAVRKSVSVTEEEAVKKRVVDLVAQNLEDLLAKADGRSVLILDQRQILHTKDALIEKAPMTFVERFLFTITHPEIVLILFMLGFYGLLYELMSPGAIVPGVVGTISLLLAFYAMGTLPVNYAGVFFMILGFILFIMDFKFPAHGTFTIGGTISLLIGSFLLVSSDYGYSRTYYAVVAVTLLFTLLFVLLVLRKLWLVRRARHVIGRENLIGQTGIVKSSLNPEGYVMVDGILWKARAKEGSIREGEKISVTGAEDMILQVTRKIETQSE